MDIDPIAPPDQVRAEHAEALREAWDYIYSARGTDLVPPDFQWRVVVALRDIDQRLNRLELGPIKSEADDGG